MTLGRHVFTGGGVWGGSESFCIKRGTMQGCPLPPLLFACITEPLAESIRQCEQLFGIKLGDEEHRISLYADDVLL